MTKNEGEALWRKENAERLREINKRSREKHKAKYATVAKAHREANPEMYRARRRKTNYGIENEHFERLMYEQQGCCAICKMAFVIDGKKSQVPVVDHNHTTGAIRGLLCLKCNNAIGLLQDSVQVILNAAEYLKMEVEKVDG